MTNADDITDFEIEGMSIGDSLLDYMSYSEIKKELDRENNFYYKNKSYVSILSSQNIYENLKFYDDLSIVIKPKNDKNFIIQGLEAQLKIDDIDKCHKKQKIIANDLKKMFQELNLKDNSYDLEKAQLKGSKDESVRYIDMLFENGEGEFRIACHERENTNLLFVIINNSEFSKAIGH